jgi:ankyrin repeat protein
MFISMSNKELIMQLQKLKSEGKDSSVIEADLSRVLYDIADQSAFYDLDLDTITRITQQNNPIDILTAKRIVQNAVDKHGPKALQLLSGIECGSIRHNSASILSFFESVPLIREALKSLRQTGAEPMYSEDDEGLLDVDYEGMMGDLRNSLQDARKTIEKKNIEIAHFKAHPEAWAEASEDDIFAAAAKGSFRRVWELLSAYRGLAVATDSDGYTAYMHAASRNKVEVMLLLAHNGANVMAESASGGTAFIWAAVNGCTDAVKFMHEAGVPIAAQNKYGASALHASACNGHVATMQFLLVNGINVNIKNVSGLTPLFCAAIRNHPSAVDLLLKSGALVDWADIDGWTALMAAANAGSKESVAALLKSGANFRKKNSEGKTALSLAKNEETKSILRDAGASH